jgi:hypothetical protein
MNRYSLSWRRRLAAWSRVGGLVALVLGCAPGCSLLIVDGPPPAEARRAADFACTKSRAVPVADLIAAAAVGVHEAGDIGNDDREWTGLALSPDHHRLLSAALVTAFAVSAGVGLTRVEACREASAQRERERRMQQEPASGGPPGAPAPLRGPPLAPGAT